MIKEKDILIRVTTELKNKIREKAISLGISVSSYIRMVLLKELGK
jgi:predicted DNA binding CopG/RHH family protein